MSKVGWIGLGAMGAAMARVVAGAGHSVIAFDVSPGRSAALAGAGVVAAPSAAAAANGGRRARRHGGHAGAGGIGPVR